MKYFNRLVTLNKIGIEFPDDIKEYVKKVHSILKNLNIGIVNDTNDAEKRYQLYDKNKIIHFEFRCEILKKSNIQSWMLSLYKNKYEQYHDLNLYIICQYYNVNIINIEDIKENHTTYNFRLGFFKPTIE